MERVLIKIKDGAHILQDGVVFNWPECLLPDSEKKENSNKTKDRITDPDVLFVAVRKNRYWHCVRDGFGALPIYEVEGEYGNGPIYVFGLDDVEIVAKNYQPKTDKI